MINLYFLQVKFSCIGIYTPKFMNNLRNLKKCPRNASYLVTVYIDLPYTFTQTHHSMRPSKYFISIKLYHERRRRQYIWLIFICIIVIYVDICHQLIIELCQDHYNRKKQSYTKVRDEIKLPWLLVISLVLSYNSVSCSQYP